MPVSTARLQPLQTDITLMFDGALGPAGRSAALAQFAADTLAEVDAKNAQALGFTPTRHTFVDGAESDNLTAVRPDGTIAAQWDVTADLLGDIDRMLISASPRASGRYARDHVLLADGVEVSVNAPPAASQYAFVNLAPYARKIEGVAGKPPLSQQAPEGVYQIVARQAAALARQRGNKEVSISYGYLPLGRAPVSRRGRSRHQTSDRVPAIIIKVR